MPLVWLVLSHHAFGLVLTVMGLPFALAAIARMLVGQRRALRALTFGCAAAPIAMRRTS